MGNQKQNKNNKTNKYDGKRQNLSKGGLSL